MDSFSVWRWLDFLTVCVIVAGTVFILVRVFRVKSRPALIFVVGFMLCLGWVCGMVGWNYQAPTGLGLMVASGGYALFRLLYRHFHPILPPPEPKFGNARLASAEELETRKVTSER